MLPKYKCSEDGCKSAGTWCVWSPLFRDAETGPRWLCDRHGDPHRPRAERQQWFCDDAALDAFLSATVVSRDHCEELYQAAAMNLFRNGSHYAGVPLGSKLDPSHTAIYLCKGCWWAVTDRFAIGLPNARDYLLRFRIPKEKVATGLTLDVARN